MFILDLDFQRLGWLLGVARLKGRLTVSTDSSGRREGTVHKHLLGGPDAKRGPLKFVTLVRGTLKKITNFLVKIEFTCFSMGLTHNFYEKKGGLEFFESEMGGPKFSRYFFFFLHQAHKQVFVNGPF